MPEPISTVKASARRHNRHWLIFWVVLLGGLLVATSIVYTVFRLTQNSQQAQFETRVASHANSLNRYLDQAFGATRQLAAIVRESGGVVEDFDGLAQDIANEYGSFDLISLSPGGVLQYVWPRQVFAGVIGTDHFNNPVQRDDAYLALHNKSLTVTGPFYLEQGDRGASARLPIFLSDEHGYERFWGFASVMLRLDLLAAQPELRALLEAGHQYRLLRRNPHNGGLDLIVESTSRPFIATYQRTLQLPNNEWLLQVERPSRLEGLPGLLLMALLALLFCVLAASLVRVLLVVRDNRRDLEHQVIERTRKIYEARNDLMSVISAIPDLLFEMDEEGRYLQFFSLHEDRLELPFEQLQGRCVSEVMPADQAALVLSALREAAHGGLSMGRQFSIGERRFELSVARKPSLNDGPARLVVLSRDITERMRAELQVRQSLQRYRSFIEASNTGAWEFDIERNRLDCSPEYFYMLGMDPRNLSLRAPAGSLDVWTELMHPDDRDMAKECFQSYVRERPESLYEIKFRLRHVERGWIWILSRGRLLCDADGGTTGRIVGTHIDIDDYVRADEQLRLTARIFEQSNEGYMVTNADQRILMVNPGFERITGYSAEEAIGQTPRMLSSGRHDATFYRDMWEALQRDGRWQGEVWNRRKDGSIYPEWLVISQVLDTAGMLTNYVAVITDISQRKQAQEQIHRLANYDALTGLPNRVLFDDRATLALSMAQRGDHSLALLFLDLDNFKNINESLGHATGDALLVAFAKRLQDLLRDEDTLSRTGGDEFILLLPDADADVATHVAQRILDAVASPLHVEGHELTVTASIGIALYPEDAEDLAGLRSNADIAMYRAKQQGRNSFSLYTPGLQAYYQRALQLENALRRALELGQLSLHYQPQHDLHSGALVGAEALLRWQHPEFGPVSPAEFIPLAENSGLIVPIGDWVLSEAVRQLAEWRASGWDLSVAVNLSGVQFMDLGLVERIRQLLQQHGVPASALELELTETITMQDPALAVTVMDSLHGLGLSVALDDFGTGYSSMSYLKRFKLDKLKIDQSFVREMHPGSDDAAIVQATIGLAQSLGMQTLAEGVETEQQRDFLRDCGCQLAQGYLLSRPLPAEAFARYLQGCGQPIAAG